MAATVHASAVLAGASAVLIRGPAGIGKSRLALAIIEAGQTGLLGFARLVGDDRIELAAAHGRLLARPAGKLAGLIEVRGLGIRHLVHEAVAMVGLVVDLAAPRAERLPGQAEREVTIEGVKIPHLAVAAGADPLRLVLACLLTEGAEI
jgi:HPr kinase/phosphorylase